MRETGEMLFRGEVQPRDLTRMVAVESGRSPRMATVAEARPLGGWGTDFCPKSMDWASIEEVLGKY